MWWEQRAFALEKLAEKGITVLSHYAFQEHERLACLIRLCAPLIQPYVRSGRLIYIFAYDRAAQPAPFNGLAGFQFGKVIGVSVEALKGKWGRDYAVGVLLHEIAHLKISGHTQEFYLHLGSLLDWYFRKTGRDLSAYSL